jgi:DNA mismatch endonuclease (patch repair protein)
MLNTPRRDTPCEVAVRRELHRRGLRYRVDRPIPGVTKARPDITFPAQRVAVFIDGCFWHLCPEHGTVPTANEWWWREKLEGNVARDQRHNTALGAAGWTVVRIWEHVEPVEAADIIESLLRARRSEPSR